MTESKTVLLRTTMPPLIAQLESALRRLCGEFGVQQAAELISQVTHGLSEADYCRKIPGRRVAQLRSLNICKLGHPRSFHRST